jgi:hypothetical protein
MSTPEEINQMIHDIEQRESRLSPWEADFVDSISKQVGEGKTLTQKQDERLEAIWEKITS